MSKILEITEKLIAELQLLGDDDRIDALNDVRCRLAAVSPMRGEPVDCVRWVPCDAVQANEYNPNHVAPPEMKLLEHSIREDGYTQPIVAFEHDDGSFEVVDGFHRNRVGKECGDIRERVRGRLPLAVINDDRTETKDRIAATIRHNRARGVHEIRPMAEIVARLYFNGWSNRMIAKELGMDKDEVLRLKQFTGIGTLFENRDFSPAWDILEPGGDA
jgi:ParB-like chromosome segregation protein Spo0J